jgi:hypothetical protein
MTCCLFEIQKSEPILHSLEKWSIFSIGIQNRIDFAIAPFLSTGMCGRGRRRHDGTPQSRLGFGGFLATGHIGGQGVIVRPTVGGSAARRQAKGVACWWRRRRGGEGRRTGLDDNTEEEGSREEEDEGGRVIGLWRDWSRDRGPFPKTFF